MGSSTPPWAFIVTAIVSIIAIITSVLIFWYGLKRADNRDIENWRRNELLKYSSKLIELSNLRNQFLSDDFDAAVGAGSRSDGWKEAKSALTEMRGLQEQVELLNASDLNRLFNEVMQLHIKAEASSYSEHPQDTVGIINAAIVQFDTLRKKHQEVIEEFHRIAKLPI